MINAPGAWARGARGRGATIAVVDTGVDLNHPDLKDNLLPGVDLVSDESCSPGAQDLNGHGTHVAGIAAAVTNNGIGVAGTAPDAKILPVRVLGADGGGSADDIDKGIEWAADHGAQVINLSLGETDPLIGIDIPIDVAQVGPAIDYAWAHGAVVVAAAGNSSFPLCSQPAGTEHAICVGAVDSDGLPSAYSNFPARTDGGVAVRAPGGDGSGSCDPSAQIWSTYWPGASGADAEQCPPMGYEPLSGTSMATPFVSGVAAILRGAGLSNQQVLDCLARTSSNGGSYDPVNGYGIVDAQAAVAGCTRAGASRGGAGGGAGAGGGPSIRLSIPARKNAHDLRRGYVTVRVRLSERARTWLQIRGGRRPAVLASRRLTLRGGHTRDLHLKLTKAGRRALRAHRTLRVTGLARARDGANRTRTRAAKGRIGR